MVFIVEDEEGAERATCADRGRHLHQGFILPDQPVVSFLRFCQLQVGDICNTTMTIAKLLGIPKYLAEKRSRYMLVKVDKYYNILQWKPI